MESKEKVLQVRTFGSFSLSWDGERISGLSRTRESLTLFLL